ncbi:MAG: ribonuclease P protein component [Firmicutes bacterium]|jgi:ribonuclease P protein component|uniref:Ribonuclease P protein component n=1 Tax=Sulfobacillus benefaciens TaxID=453960 RepID=A0A2T2WU24_9FIRM|nr:ribonuclease P protein component [Bacillota bacterium]MCL5012726.1 ribonuclease P protein component [Bacillota bacterium]PSR25722.1 MAG: ribonuclease P protein component [Sulfobacillus benefaciens]HBQ96408.1 ribonuclease P protein component [Sulfobacillus sp.]
MAQFHRLKKRSDFGRVFRLGRTVGDRNMVLFVLSCETVMPRVGFTTQRSAGSAVKRNRIRRRLRALFSIFAEEISPCGDLILLGKKPVLTEDWDVLVRSMRKLLLRAGCLKKERQSL